ncbi:hypothetical protein, partial [Escherichia coli]|uniref:hypothetical protein n=1 Tax=Escherichia coli TaxID=562 RepID=UPI001075FE27
MDVAAVFKGADFTLLPTTARLRSWSCRSRRQSDVTAQADRAAELRATANARPGPPGLTALLTGAEGFAVDVAAVFKGADFTLL